LSSLVEFEDLGELDGGDLRAVLNEVPSELLIAALSGASAGLRTQLLTKLPESSAASLQALLGERGPVNPAASTYAQRTVVDALCRLSRVGQVAFDDPADMLDLVA
jgi:flagellar motor switch protein FliG